MGTAFLDHIVDEDYEYENVLSCTPHVFSEVSGTDLEPEMRFHCIKPDRPRLLTPICGDISEGGISDDSWGRRPTRSCAP